MAESLFIRADEVIRLLGGPNRKLIRVIMNVKYDTILVVRMVKTK